MPNSCPLADEALVAGCLKGQKESWSAFVDGFSRLVYWSLRKALESTAYRGRQDLLDDLFQEFFRRLLEGDYLARLRNAESIRKYLSVTACHLAMDKAKSLRRWAVKDIGAGEETDEGPEGELAFFGPSASETAAKRESDAVVAEVLGELSSKERLCAEWHWLDGKSHREIAQGLGIPQDTVSTVLRRTKEKLRKRFLEKGLAE